jgi:hypothetical protein
VTRMAAQIAGVCLFCAADETIGRSFNSRKPRLPARRSDSPDSEASK